MKDAVATMGGLLPADAGGRDAVHVAVFSARSPVKVYPSQEVGLVDIEPVEFGDTVVSPLANHIGIVDPFLKVAANPGQRFWVYLYPRTIISLSHKWGHPAFVEPDSARAISMAVASAPGFDPSRVYVTPTMKLDSERRLLELCATWDLNYDALLKAVEAWDSDGEYLTIYGSDASGDIPQEIWGHIENITGKRLPVEKPAYFSCSC